MNRCGTVVLNWLTFFFRNCWQEICPACIDTDGVLSNSSPSGKTKGWLTKEDSPFVWRIRRSSAVSSTITLFSCVYWSWYVWEAFSVICFSWELRTVFVTAAFRAWCDEQGACLHGRIFRALKLMVRCLVSASEFTSPVPFVRSWSIHSTR